jgi:hypothetical protein
MTTVKTATSWLGILCMAQLLAPASTHAASVSAAPTPAGTHPTPVYRTQVASHGVKLSLTFPRRVYPRDALVRVSVRLVNVSLRVVLIGRTEAAVCAQQGPGIRVTDSTHRNLYPPAITWLLASCGPPIDPRPLLPGHVMQRKLLAILRGDRIQAVASVGLKSIEVTTPPLSMVLVPEPAPRAVVRIAFLSHIDVTPSTLSQQGRFYFMESEFCFAATPSAQGAVGSASGMTHFQFTTPDQHGVYRFSTICGSPSRWSFTGGWLNHRAVSVNYSRPNKATR